jgi:hypothetical protein
VLARVPPSIPTEAHVGDQPIAPFRSSPEVSAGGPSGVVLRMDEVVEVGVSAVRPVNQALAPPVFNTNMAAQLEQYEHDMGDLGERIFSPFHVSRPLELPNGEAELDRLALDAPNVSGIG